MTKVMDCVIYNHASLLDMIEKESAEFEPWYTAGSIAESHSKNYGFIAGNDVISSVKSTTSSLFDDLNRLESLNGSVFSSGLQAMETDWLDREECMNWDPQLLVNPRTGAPVDSSDSDLTFNSKLVLKKDIDNALNILTRPASGDDKGSKLAEVAPVKGDITIPSRQLQTFTTFTIAEPNISNPNVPLALQSQLIASSTNTMPVQVILQVTNAVGSIVPTDGTLCLIKMEDEEQTVKLPVSAANSQIPAVSVQAEEEGDEAAGECSENFEKPVFSYSCLIAMALKNSESGSLPVNEIYAYILEKFPYFRTAPDGWKNSIRHNLSLNKCFEKIENPTVNGGSRKGCLWGLNPAKADKMDDEIAKWIKRAAKANNNNGKEIVGNQLLHAGVALNDGESHIVAPSSTPTYVTVCSQPQSLSSLSGPAITVSSSSGELDILEDSIESSDPMLAGIAVQNGLWDDLTETDELMSTAFSFGNGQLTKASKSSAINNRIRTSSATCRSSHAKVTSSLSSDRPHTSSTPVAIIANQAAIG